MAKLTLTDISAGYNAVATTNANNALVEAALENTLSRDGTVPNTMAADLDMNSNKITNLTDGTAAQDAVSLAQLQGATTALNELSDLDDVTSAAVTAGFVLVADGAAYVGIAPVETGGFTGQTTYTTGDVLYSDSANSLAKLAVGTNGDVLTLAAGIPSWVAPAAAGMANVVEDLTPQLGGDLSLNSSDITGTGNINITGTIAATSYGGIAEADLVSKGATEVIAGSWTYTADIISSDGVDSLTLSTTGGVTSAIGTGGLTLLDLNIPVQVNSLVLQGSISMADNVISRPVLTDYGITSTSPSSSANAITLNLVNGNAFQTTLTENITTVTLSNPPATGTYGELVWKVIQDSVARTITWPASVNWPAATAPVISTGSGDVDIITLKTWDGGTTWYGNFAQAYA